MASVYLESRKEGNFAKDGDCAKGGAYSGSSPRYPINKSRERVSVPEIFGLQESSDNITRFVVETSERRLEDCRLETGERKVRTSIPFSVYAAMNRED